MSATVIATYGKFSLVEIAKGEEMSCTKRSNLEPVVIGDKVEYTDTAITRILPRTTLLKDNDKNIAANITRIFIVVAVLPHPSLISIDSYVIKCHSIGITPILVINKVDLEKSAKVTQLLEMYSNIGYEVLPISAMTQYNLKHIATRIDGHSCVFVGHSGVGKSSIINAISNKTLRVNTLGSDGLGKHTTTNSSLFYSCGGSIIDTPGVREFIASDIDKNTILSGFIEFKKYLGKCKFNNCKHINEPNCRIKEKVKSGEIYRYRYNNYCELITPHL